MVINNQVILAWCIKTVSDNNSYLSISYPITFNQIFASFLGWHKTKKYTNTESKYAREFFIQQETTSGCICYFSAPYTTVLIVGI